MISFPVITAHGLTTKSVSEPTHLSIPAFIAWVDRCLESGFHFQALRHELFNQKNALPQEKAIFLTCDDALASVSVMAELINGPATLFVVTDYVGKSNQWPGQPAWVPKERCLDWSEIRNLADRGWTIAAHSRTHPSFHRLNTSEIRDEINGSVQTIEDQIGRPCPFFAYPYGHAPMAAQSLVHEMHLVAFGTSPGWIDEKSSRTALPRIDLYDLARPGLAKNWFCHRPQSFELHALKSKRFAGQLWKQVRFK